jgi:hypothetical protein
VHFFLVVIGLNIPDVELAVSQQRLVRDTDFG